MQALAPVTLAGRYARLEPLALAHIPGLMAAAAGPRETFVWTFVPDAEKAMHAYVELALAEQQAGRMIPFATVDAATGHVLGSTRFCNIERWAWPAGSPRLRPPGCADAVEIGYTWLHPSSQRSAVNTEAKRMMLAHAFEVWEVHRVTLKTDERNARSRAAIERIGGRLDGLLRGHMPASDGGVRTSAVYTIVASEWPAVRARLDARLGA
jgi:RimJ/RimL family protein N-acetyltransferase